MIYNLPYGLTGKQDPMSLDEWRSYVAHNLKDVYIDIFDDHRIQRLHDMIPEYMHEGLLRYVLLGVQPGDFLTAILTNDYNKAVAHADADNRKALANYSIWLFNYAPMNCHGSREKYNIWREMGGLANVVYESDLRAKSA